MIWGNWSLRVSLIVLLFGLTPHVALAQIDQDWKFCKPDGDTPSHLAISDCTGLIEAKGLSQEDVAKAYYNRGAAYWRRGDYDAAIADENEAIEINPNLADAYMRRGAAYANKGDMDQAIAEASKAIELDPENVRAYINRGSARTRKDDIAGAIADATKAIKIDPQFPAAYLARGGAYARKGEHGTAFADYNKALELAPRNGFDGYRPRGFIFAQAIIVTLSQSLLVGSILIPTTPLLWHLAQMLMRGKATMTTGSPMPARRLR